MRIFHGNGTRLISPKKEKEFQNKENDDEYLCRELVI
jgi:hypothetical protein